ncbi:homocysteine S-methyltransferase 2 [Acidimicrobiaceae bacterium]|nr:homocysteine S-methyltransferase 2 [Acidimicrobiaceae bacterium]
MSYQNIKRRLDAGEVIVLDGGTGTELQRRGAQMDPSAWCGPASLNNSELLTQVHIDYINAGADVITANTFASSRLMLTPAGYADRVEEINRIAVEAALRARDLATAKSPSRKIAVAGSLSHMVPVAAGTAKVDQTRVPSNDELAHAFGELANILKDSGVDHIMLEMMYEPNRVPIALNAALATGLPVWFGMSTRRAADGHVVTFDQHQEIPLEEVTKLIPKSGVDVAGVMHTGAELISDSLAAIRKHFAGPMSAYPDSGFFEMPDWRFVDVISPERLETFFSDWISNGAQLIGGCCGLTVDHIHAATRTQKSLNR